MKHNNVIANQHFRKDWQRRVKTWFDQPARKQRRRNARVEKAKKVAPRPINALRPIVRCPTIKYNTRIRAGRGFTLAELKAAKINKRAALGMGVTVDCRRVNRSEEGFQTNVQRLKTYRSKLVVFPRKGPKKVKRGDSTKEACAAVKQVTDKQTLPISVPKTKIKARKITTAEKSFEAAKTVRKARTDAKLWGAREKRAADKAEAAPKKK